MSWLRRLLGADPGPARGAHEERTRRALADDQPVGGAVFVCSTCGRADLPEAGGWDPPICLECDAEVSFAAIEEVELTEDW